ncbi:hypothetical protein GGS23DRAFT_564372 [Durotheca rogersii]|uniref:uncharacterized protein n=1 Tax=Durotheca rogersii TaxID=419775 RepID=UPI00222037E1|nr:uncharacterized protein GGS23DRAFT_564372 [Durotheca rogersii]KAI5864435.1 hypothetical protein GGS23DRAFT_564372 [Durotheca rogersii]
MSFFRITLHRSAIGMPRRTRGVLASLGLRKRQQTVFHPVSPEFAGKIMRVKELVRVAEVDRALSPAELRAERAPEPGFWLERPVPRSPITPVGRDVAPPPAPPAAQPQEEARPEGPGA